MRYDQKNKHTTRYSFFESSSEVHCFQACLKMVLAYWLPQKKYSLKDLDKISGHEKNMWTWQGNALLYLVKQGFSVTNIENLNYKAFAQKGSLYLKSIWSKETYNAQKKYSYLKREQKIAQRLIENTNIRLIYRDVTFQDVINLMNHGYMVLVSVNPYILRGQKGYSSHMIVITRISNNFVYFHDPGPPGKANRKVARKKFKKSMTRPAKEDGNIIGIKFTG